MSSSVRASPGVGSTGSPVTAPSPANADTPSVSPTEPPTDTSGASSLSPAAAPPRNTACTDTSGSAPGNRCRLHHTDNSSGAPDTTSS
ncbi:hypothetical protein [Nocardiopsis flavescens]